MRFFFSWAGLMWFIETQINGLYLDFIEQQVSHSFFRGNTTFTKFKFNLNMFNARNDLLHSLLFFFSYTRGALSVEVG